MPAPPRRAAPEHRIPAPGYGGDPATTPTTPRVYLSSFSPGNGTSAAASASPIRLTTGCPASARSSPMSINVRSPTSPAPGLTNKPGLRQPNVTVSCAQIAADGSATAPVSASTPLGRSTATTTAADAPARAASSAAGERKAPAPPMPRIPSSTRSAVSIRG